MIVFIYRNKEKRQTSILFWIETNLQKRNISFEEDQFKQI